MSQYILSLASALLSLISFFWIGLRREIPDLKKKLSKAPSTARKIKAALVHFVPYVAGVVGITCLAWLALTPPPVEIAYHSFQMVRTKSETVPVEGRRIIDIFSSNEHFQVTVEGVFFGPELRKLKEFLRTSGAPKVYAIVNEESRPSSRGLQWLQVNESGTLGERGHYECRAFLGGIGQDRAQDGELFSVRIYIPRDSAIPFPDYAVYDARTLLPKPLYISEPLYIRTWRNPRK